MPLIHATEASRMSSSPGSEAQGEALLSIRDLNVDFSVEGRTITAVQGACMSVYPGKTCALVGESGSGKSVTALSVLRLLPARIARTSGEILFEGRDMLRLDEKSLREVRGGRVGMIFQEPMTSLNPLHPIGRQIAENVILHQPGADAQKRTLELLDLVGIPDAASRLSSFPHQLSGGQRQRVMIAMALANDPVLLIADEPTTALDVTIQAQVLDLLKDLQKRLNMAILLISHDLGVVRHMADEVHVMREGRIVESGTRDEIFQNPGHAYTKTLLTSTPSGRPGPLATDAPTLIEARGVRVWFPQGKTLLGRPISHIKAVTDAELSIRQGESLGVVGESGSGKTTLGLALLRLQSCQGEVDFDGQRISDLREGQIRAMRRNFQIVFQDPYGSLSPRMTVGQIVAEGLDAHRLAVGEERRERIAEILEAVDLDPEAMHRYPHEFSGGQRQRISIARALILRPKFVVLDEPTSALDRTVQFQIVELLRNLQDRFGLTYMFITHDLALVRALCHRIVIMKDGRIVEQGPTDTIFASPVQEYTRTLLAAALE
ncbi:microcin C transport system ATP-binding protein [Desulfomicrobium apsheronum]|uniref:Microcin C transport system ATP-binding protein n=1 Tax=Desulfomicrobium apsheronum TaxID=52560 RepID=A0A1I3WU45_9BACT|nr:ABC transporter ATP-binding protein [Desulfomicrobium apsheronum]SFK11038.1 microcin C transport system ATP-binding protein [Desulfomicrobium apsheronum]